MAACPPGASACGDEAGELWAYAVGGNRGEVTGAAPLAEGGRGLGGPSAPGEGSGPLLTPAHRLLGRRDSSGIRLHYTATLRRFNAGIMELGLVYTPVMAVPPREEAFVLTGYCTDKCTQLVSGAGPGCPAEAPQVQVGAEGGRSVALVPLPRVPLGPSALLSLRSRNQAPTSPTPRVSASGRRVLKHVLLSRAGQTRVPHQELRGAPLMKRPAPAPSPGPRESAWWLSVSQTSVRIPAHPLSGKRLTANYRASACPGLVFYHCLAPCSLAVTRTHGGEGGAHEASGVLRA